MRSWVTAKRARPASQRHREYEAWKTYGRGNSPAGLNFGDCLGYALAKQTNRPLLYKGKDFAQTDVKLAASPYEGD